LPATKYKIWQVANAVGQGATQSLHVGVAGVAKGNSPDYPYVVSNELVCNQLARAIILPTPPGFIIEHNSQPYYVSLNFNLAGQDLPPADPVAVIQGSPDLACGIILFDIWVVNEDRHRENIAYYEEANKVHIFDHSHAFFSTIGPARLERHKNALGIVGHCLAPELTTFTGMKKWHERILQIPEFYIRETIEAAVEVGLPANSVGLCCDFLLERRQQLPHLLETHQAVFPKVKKQLWSEI
jgi:hypothetical protein